MTAQYTSNPEPDGRLRVTLLNLFAHHGGAERCAQDLLAGLLQRHHLARLLVGRSNSPRTELGPHVSLFPRFFPEFALQRILWRVLGLTDTTQLLPLWHALRHPDLVGAEVVHYHGLNGSYLNLWMLPLLARRTPLVMTLHDMWPLTGDCNHSESCERWQRHCGNCPLFERPRDQRGGLGTRDLTRFNLAVKRSVFRRIKPHRLLVVSPSRWLADKAAASHLGRFSIAVIPNGLDLKAWSPEDRAVALRELGLPATRRYIAAVAGSWLNPHKGGELLAPLARGLSLMPSVTLLVAGRIPATMQQDLERVGAVVLAGNQDSDVLRCIFSVSEAFLLLSRNENLPYVVSESLACGCPVLARDVGGVAEMLEPAMRSWLVPAHAGAAGFVASVHRLLSLPAVDRQHLRQASRLHAEKTFSLDRMVDSYERAYRALRVPSARLRISPPCMPAARTA